MAGRRPKPTALKKLAGNPGGRPLNELEPKPPTGMPEMPKGMNHAARREWKIITKALAAMGVLSIVDGKALGQYCELMGFAEVYRNEFSAEPMVEEPIVNKDGNVVGYKKKVNPAFSAYLGASKAAKNYLTEFGLTPSSRSRLKVDSKPKPPEDPMAKLLNSEPTPAENPAEPEIDLNEIDEGSVM